MKSDNYKKIAVVTIFAIAMAFLETTVVVYLRKLYYLGGFDFPLKGFIEPWVLNIEWVREFFTIVMLASIGFLAAKKFYVRFAYFLYSFAVWDLFYYIWLKVILDWPASWLTWDLLFLIPLPWVSPVLAPIICSLTMMTLGLLIICFEDKGKKINLNAREWTFLIAGALIILYTFLYDYSNLIIGGGFAKEFFNLATNSKFIEIISDYIPASYMWGKFIIGEIFIVTSIVLFYIRVRKK
ncbi:MAG: hypothetical protein Q8L47_00760 [bacterium]|nr:hypothetical protein [bacterium]